MFSSTNISCSVRTSVLCFICMHSDFQFIVFESPIFSVLGHRIHTLFTQFTVFSAVLGRSVLSCLLSA